MSETMLWDISSSIYSIHSIHSIYTPVEYQYLRIYAIFIYVYPLRCFEIIKSRLNTIDFCVYLYDGDHSIDRSLDH